MAGYCGQVKPYSFWGRKAEEMTLCSVCSLQSCIPPFPNMSPSSTFRVTYKAGILTQEAQWQPCFDGNPHLMNLHITMEILSAGFFVHV